MHVGEFFSYGPKSTLKAGDAVIDGKYRFFTSSNDEDKRCCEYQFEGEGIIMGTGGNATLHYCNDKFSVSTDCVVILPSEKIKCKYLYYFFLANIAILEAGFKGAGLKHTSKNYISNIELNNIPSLVEQEKIIAILDMANQVVHNLREEITTLDTLIKARFVEMFGDPVRNEKEWNTRAIEDVCKYVVDCPHSTPNYTSEDTGFMCIRTSIIKKNRIMWDDIEYISEEEYLQRIQRKKPEKGDVIYTREGAILGIAAVIDRDCNVALGQRSMLLSPDRAFCTPEFISVAMNFDSFLANALKGMSGSASPHINVGDIKACMMIQPPITQQETFSDFITQVDKSKFVFPNFQFSYYYMCSRNRGNHKWPTSITSLMKRILLFSQNLRYRRNRYIRSTQRPVS